MLPCKSFPQSAASVLLGQISRLVLSLQDHLGAVARTFAGEITARQSGTMQGKTTAPLSPQFTSQRHSSLPNGCWGYSLMCPALTLTGCSPLSLLSHAEKLMLSCLATPTCRRPSPSDGASSCSGNHLSHSALRSLLSSAQLQPSSPPSPGGSELVLPQLTLKPTTRCPHVQSHLVLEASSQHATTI